MSRGLPAQCSLDWRSPRQRLDEDTSALYGAVRAAIEAAGGIDWLTAALDREPSYQSKISEGINRREGRHVHLDWLAPLLADRAAAELLIAWLCERCGYDPPRRKRVVTRAELAEALLAELEEAGAVGEALRERVARRLGTDLGAVRR